MFKQKSKLLASVFRVSLLTVLAIGVAISFVALRNPQSANAATNSTLNFQARLLTAAGNTVPDGNYNIEFKIYNASSSSGSSQGSCSGDAACLWTETRTTSNKVRVANGYLTVNLGSVNAFSSTINWDQELWLTMNVGGTGTPGWDGEMTPRLKLTAVPYAFRAGALVAQNGANTNTVTFAAPTGTRTITIPDESGTICLQSSSACGFLTTATANSSYIQNQTSISQTANFRISGTGRVDTALQAPLLDTAGAQVLDIGTTNATGINLNQNTTLASGKTLTIQGNTLLQPASNGTAVFNVKNAGAANVFTIDTTNTRIGVGLGGSTLPTLQNSGVEIKGAIRLSGADSGYSDRYTTPGGTQVDSLINVLNYSPNNFGQIVAMGVPSGSLSTVRVISLFDARSSAHQPTLAVLSPNEAQIAGFSWEGSNTTFTTKTSSDNMALQANGLNILMLQNVSSVARVGIGNDTPSYPLDVTGDINSSTALRVGGNVVCTSSGCTSAATLQSAYDSGNTITTTSGRNVSIALADTATDSNFSVNMQCTTCSTSGGRFEVQNAGTAAFWLNPGSSAGQRGTAVFRNTTNDVNAFQVQNAAGSTTIFNVDTQNERVGIGGAAVFSKFEVTGGDAAIYNSGNNPRLVLGDSTAGGENGYLQWDSTNNYFRIETVGTNGLKVNDNYVSIGDIFPGQPLIVGNGAVSLFEINTTGNITLGNSADKTFSIAQAGSGNNGNSLTFQAGSGNGTNKNGGDLILQGGNSTGSGTPGGVIVRPQTNRVSAFQVQNSGGGSTIFNVDTTNGRVGINNAAPTVALDVGPGTLGTSEVVQIRIGDFLLQSQQGAANGLAALTSRGSNGNLTLDGASGSALYLSPFTTNHNYLAAGGGSVRVGSTSTPSYKLDVTGDINTSTAIRVGGTIVCDTTGGTGCIAKTGSGFYIHNQTTVQAANLYVQAATTGTVAAKFQAFNGGSGNIAEFLNGTGTTVGSISSTGAVLVKPSTNATSAFQVQPSGSTTPVLNVDTSNSFVGIGTATPSRIFHAVANNTQTTAPMALLEQTSTGDATLEFKTPAKSFIIGQDASDASKFKVSSSTASASPGTFGKTSIGALEDTGDNGFMECSKATTPGSAGLTSTFFIYEKGSLDASNKLYQVAIYTDNGSGTSPNALVASSSSATLTADAWNSVSISATLSSSTTYWLCANTNSSSSTLNNWAYDTVSNAGNFKAQAYGTWPSTYTSGGAGSVSSQQFSFYVSFAPSGTYDSFTKSLMTLDESGQVLFQNSSDSTTAFQIQNAAGTTLLSVDTSGNNVTVGGGFSTSDTTSTLLNLDSNTTFTESATCSASAAGGAMYYNSAQASSSQGGSTAIRACIGGAWEDLASVGDLGLQVFGVVPDSGPTAGDQIGITALTNSSCKVTWASSTTVNVSNCVAYTGGRKVVISSVSTLTGFSGTSLTYHVCLNGTNGLPTRSTGGTETANLPTFSAGSPILCIADVKTGAGNTITNIYDTRAFTTSVKQFVTINSAAAPGMIVRYNTAGTAGTVETTTTGDATTVAGVIVASSGSASTNTVNGIMVTAGLGYVKATASSFGTQAATSTTAGYAANSSANAVNSMLGPKMRALDASCNAATNCQFAVPVQIGPH